MLSAASVVASAAARSNVDLPTLLKPTIEQHAPSPKVSVKRVKSDE
jgi:hypothetical protein